MNDATRRHLREWGWEQGEIDVVAQLAELDVEIDLFILAQVIAVNRKVNKLMADVSALEAAIDSLTAADESVASALNELRDEVSTLEAGSISQEKIDSLTSKVTNAVTALGNAVNPTQPPAEEPATGGEEEAPPAPPAEG